MKNTLFQGFLAATLGIIPSSIGHERVTLVEYASAKNMQESSPKTGGVKDKFVTTITNALNNPTQHKLKPEENNEIERNIIRQWQMEQENSKSMSISCRNEEVFVENLAIFLNDIQENVTDYRIRTILQKQSIDFPENFLIGSNEEMSCEEVFEDNGQAVLQLNILFNFLDNNPEFINEFNGRERYFMPYEEYPNIQEHVKFPTTRDLYEGNFDIHSVKYMTLYLWGRRDSIYKE